MTPKTITVEHTAFAQRVETGWIGVYTFPRDGVACTEQVKRVGRLRVFHSELSAQAAAGLALCRALNVEAVPRRPGKTFAVRHVGGRARVVAEAQRHFRIGGTV